MRLAFLSLVFLLPAAAAPAQIRVDVDTTFNDPTCDELGTQLQAQGAYLAFQKMTGEADAAGLDGDGDGQACENLPIAKREVLALDTATAAWIRDSTAHHVAMSDSGDVWIDFQFTATDTTRTDSNRVVNYTLEPWRFNCGGPDIAGNGITYVEAYQARERRALLEHDKRYLDFKNRNDCFHMMGALQDPK